jgi:dCTP deaminase
MTHRSPALLFAGSQSDDLEPQHATGLLPAQHLKSLIEHSREIRGIEPVEPDQLQPASLDLRLGARVYHVRASFLPGASATVQDKIDELAMHQFELDDAGAVLEKGCVYIVPLLESLALKKRSAIANPKSSIGRIDVFTRLITDRSYGSFHIDVDTCLMKGGDNFSLAWGTSHCF